MGSLSFRLLRTDDHHPIQAMTQGSGHSLPFNYAAQMCYIAEYNHSVVGFAFGKMGYGDDSHTLYIDNIYLKSTHRTDDNVNAFRQAFMVWAICQRYATHVVEDASDTVHPIREERYHPPVAVNDIEPIFVPA